MLASQSARASVIPVPRKSASRLLGGWVTNRLDMAKKIGLLFSGQGAQVVGMGKDLADEFPVAADLFRNADAILGRPLSDIAWNGPLEELTKTSNCQPALFVHGLAALAVLRELAGEFAIEAAAGLSLGEL